MKKILIFTFALFFLITAFAADTISVFVEVSADDSSLKEQVNSYICREFRDLHDVTISDNEGASDYSIKIVALPLKTVAGIQNGFALSLLVCEPFYTNCFASFMESSSERNLAIRVTEGQVKIADHEILICGPSGLKQQCEQIVASIDSSFFDFTRKQNTQIKQIVDNLTATNHQSKVTSSVHPLTDAEVGITNSP